MHIQKWRKLSQQLGGQYRPPVNNLATLQIDQALLADAKIAQLATAFDSWAWLGQMQARAITERWSLTRKPTWLRH